MILEEINRLREHLYTVPGDDLACFHLGNMTVSELRVILMDHWIMYITGFKKACDEKDSVSGRSGLVESLEP